MKKVLIFLIVLIVLVATLIAVFPGIRDELQWRWTSHNDRAEDYAGYLESWPKGNHVSKAREELDEKSWQKAQELNTAESYKNYLIKHPQGKYFDRAHNKLAGSIEGKLLLGNGKPVKSATVVLCIVTEQKECVLQTKFSAITDGKGRFVISNLEPATYIITYELYGTNKTTWINQDGITIRYENLDAIAESAKSDLILKGEIEMELALNMASGTMRNVINGAVFISKLGLWLEFRNREPITITIEAMQKIKLNVVATGGEK